MTIPSQMNCSHDDEGWCLQCVGELEEERLKLERERDAYLGLIVKPWTREDGWTGFKVNLAWLDTFRGRDEAVAVVRKAAGLPPEPSVPQRYRPGTPDPCPSCGGQAKFMEEGGADCWYECHSCSFCGPEKELLRDALAAWNVNARKIKGAAK
jgi:hypothetical protein